MNTQNKPTILSGEELVEGLGEVKAADVIPDDDNLEIQQTQKVIKPAINKEKETDISDVSFEWFLNTL